MSRTEPDSPLFVVRDRRHADAGDDGEPPRVVVLDEEPQRHPILVGQRGLEIPVVEIEQVELEVLCLVHRPEAHEELTTGGGHGHESSLSSLGREWVAAAWTVHTIVHPVSDPLAPKVANSSGRRGPMRVAAAPLARYRARARATPIARPAEQCTRSASTSSTPPTEYGCPRSPL
jgi:hypothetical protein